MKTVLSLLPMAGLGLLLLVGCGDETADETADEVIFEGYGAEEGKADCSGCPNYAAGTKVLYEVQVRAANACHPDFGSDSQKAACRDKVSPKVTYRAEGMSCGDIDNLHKIKLGTLDDMLEDTADYRKGITLRYVQERVGANVIWLMPLFPNNDTWSIPDACDDLGSPYAVRDYMHARGSLSRACIADNRDEHSDEPCWGNADLKRVIDDAHSRGIQIWLDVAFNHFGHNYTLYDYEAFWPTRDRLAEGGDPGALWNFDATWEENLVNPKLLDSAERLDELAAGDDWYAERLDALKAKCPDLEGNALVRAFSVWRVAFDWERDAFSCGDLFLEQAAPGFYLGSDSWSPSKQAGDNLTNNWVDVKFLYHQETNDANSHQFLRTREYLFRIMNYWTAMGVDGFRLDHTTEHANGLNPNVWRYVTWKTNYYAAKRGQNKPIYLAEEFHDQMGMKEVVDLMTEGYVGDMCGRNGKIKDTHHVERVFRNMARFEGDSYVMTALETHDEHRLTDGTGFNPWTGAGFWGLGLTTWSTPMLVMGQEFGAKWGLAFRRSDFLRSRFEYNDQYMVEGDKLVDYYHSLISARLDHANRALVASPYAFLRTKSGNGVDDRLFVQAKWSGDGNVVFTAHNLWEVDAANSYYISPGLAKALWIDDGRRYKLVDAISGRQLGDCHTGADLKWSLHIEMDAGTRAQWMRLETCD